MIIEQPAKWLRWLYPRATWRMDKNEKAVYLTFDDGPIPESTPFILKTLAEYGAHATFFMVGENVSKHPELFRQIVEAGHQVGNHTYNHWGGFKHSTKAYSANTEKANRLINAHLFRPPHGWMLWEQYFWLGRKYRIVMWDLVTRDYSKWLTAEDVLKHYLTPSGGKGFSLLPARLSGRWDRLGNPVQPKGTRRSSTVSGVSVAKTTYLSRRWIPT